MPGDAERNALAATGPLPAFYWTGRTPMACLRDAITQTLEHGCAHHSQRLMVTGLHALLPGVRPQDVHRWCLAVYLDAVEWVELPNTLDLGQLADGAPVAGLPDGTGQMAGKPCVTTGKYIQRMGNHCAGCRFKPDQCTGADACPFTTLSWDFLGRHQPSLARDPRMALQVKNLARLSDEQRAATSDRADAVRTGVPDSAPDSLRPGR